MIEIVAAVPEHVRPIALNMRGEDRREVKKFGRHSPIRALVQSERYSILKWTVLEDGVPIAMFGAGEMGLNPLTDEGVVWFLGTERVRLYPREFIVLGREYILEMLKVFKSLTNVIDYDNVLAIRYARALVKFFPCGELVKEEMGLRIIIRGD